MNDMVAPFGKLICMARARDELDGKIEQLAQSVVGGSARHEVDFAARFARIDQARDAFPIAIGRLPYA